MTGRRWLAAALLALAFLAYSPGFGGPFLFDDYSALPANAYLQFDAAEFDAWRTAALSSGSGPLRRPVAMFTFALNQVAAGEVSAFWIKLTNGLVHALVGGLVYLLACSLFAHLLGPGQDSRARWLGLLAAAVWLLHPLHVSTVLYAVQRMAQLAALFAVAGLALFAHCRARWARVGAGVGEVAAVGLWLALLTLLAAYSKENGALLPLLVVVVEVCFFRGIWAGRPVSWLRRASVAALAAWFGALLLVALFPPEFLLERFARREFDLHERVLTQLRLLWHYLFWFAVPDVSAMGFQHDDIPLSRGWLAPPTTLLAGLAWLAALAAAVALRRRTPLPLFALLFYLAGHSMESGVWPLEMVYEHRNYLPLVGPCLLAAWLLALPFERGRATARAAIALPAGVLVLLLALLLVRVDTWSEELRMAGVTVQNHPQSSRSHYFYANALLTRYRQASELGLSEREARDALIGARYHFERMYETNPRDVAALVMLHSLDSQFAADAPTRHDWLGELEALLASRELQASDLNALYGLVDCLVQGGCDADRERILAMFEDLEARYPRRVTVLGMRFTYLLGSGADDAELQAIIDRALALSPGRPEFLYRQIQLQARQADVDGMYDTVAQWLSYDEGRRRLLRIKSLFIVPGDVEG